MLLKALRIQRMGTLAAIESIKNAVIVTDEHELDELQWYDSITKDYWVELHKRFRYLDDLIKWLEAHPQYQHLNTEADVWLIRGIEDSHDGGPRI